MTSTAPETHVVAEVRGRVGCLTLNRPKALNALSLDMIRRITQALQAWKDDGMVLAVVVRGVSKDGPFGTFCAGGDIRFFHQAALGGDAALEAFFTEEYALNHLVHTYPKPYIALMDGIVMGGGMGISQGASLRIVTERCKVAMPETGIGLFPDVGGGYFLSRCAGHTGEYLALTGCVLDGAQAVAMARRTNYDLVLMDVQLPLLDGCEAARQIRRLPLGAGLPIVALTSSVFSDDQTRCREAGMDDFIGRPVDAEELLGVVLRWLDQRPG